jgi:cobaltochelatase CobN
MPNPINIKNDQQENHKIPQITLISSMVCTRGLTDAIEEIKKEHGEIFQFHLFFINDLNSGTVDLEDFKQLLHTSKIVMIDIRGNNPAVEELVNIYKEMQVNDPKLYEEKVIISLVGGNAELRELTKMGSFEAKKIPSKKAEGLGFEEIPDLTDLVKKGIRISQNLQKMGKILPFGMMRHVRNWTMAMDYWVYGYSGIPENHKNLLLFLLKEYLGIKKLNVPPPLKIPPFGIFDPVENQYFATLSEYLHHHPLDPEKQTIGIFYYGGIYFEQTLPILTEFMQNLKDFNTIPVYAEVLHNLDALQQFFFIDSQPIVECVINLQYFQLNGGPFGGNNAPTLEIYQNINGPQFNPVINFDMNIEDYLTSKQGILPINQVIAVIMPEIDGRIEMMNVGCMESLGYSDTIASGVFDIVPLSDNIQFIARRVRKWMHLRKKSNAEKKIAFILYDYPPGEGTLGNASYLDVFASLEHILKELQSEGYNISPDAFKRPIIDTLLASGIINRPEHISLQKFMGIRLEKKDYQQLITNIPESIIKEITKVWGDFPGTIMMTQNQILLPILQLGNIYIGLQPPRAQYADMSQEYHNKDLAPHHQYLAFYRYLEQHINVDAVIHVGTHGTVEFLPGKENVGYWTDYNLYFLGAMPHIYLYHVSNTSESTIAKRRSNAVIINHSPPVLQLSESYEDTERIEGLILEYKNIKESEHPEREKSLQNLEKEIRTLAELSNIQYSSISDLSQTLYRMKIASIPKGLHQFGNQFSIDDTADLLLDILLHSGMVSAEIKNILPIFGMINKEFANFRELKEYIRLILKNNSMVTDFIKNFNIPEQLHLNFQTWALELGNRIQQSQERINLILALQGGFIPPGFGGDPIRSPDIFPTGRNSYGFDPRLIPSTIAYKRGSEITETLLKQHLTQKGIYPETVSVVLWAFETMKSGGETIGQIFNYLGVRAIKQKSVWTTELEVIPLDQMAHPRINVVVTICGIFRDTFPYLMDLINQAIDLVTNLDEPLERNYVKKTYLKLKEKHMIVPNARVFGPAPGKYNTNLTDIIGEGTWKDESELANDYLINMSHAYLSHQKIVAAPDSFQANVSQIAYLSQVRDSTEYHVTDLDHYYEFSGGLIKAAESITGQKPSLFIADTSSAEITIAPIEQMINEGVITRNLNPKWISGMLQHKHHGTQKVAERMENLLGFSATTHQVDNWIWEKSFDRYIKDESIRNQLKDNNQFAMMKMIKTMLEAEQRGYWKTLEDNIQILKKLYLELEGWVEKRYQ